MIRFDNVSKIYATGVQANSNISFDVNIGEVVGIVGPNGSGKTTLLRQLFKILEISKGNITVDDSKEYLDKIAYVPQFAANYPGLTVYETIYITFKYQGYRKKEAMSLTEKVLKDTDLMELRNQFAYTLSGGQSKLLAFACALAKDKPYIILDEVTSMVDIVTKERIWKLIEDNKHNKGILIASHDMSEIKRLCDKMIVLKNGEVVYKGKTGDIGTEFCKADLYVDSLENKDRLIAFMSNKAINFEEVNDKISIVANDLNEMISIVNDIKMSVQINGFECEYPAFYEGVLSIVKGNK